MILVVESVRFKKLIPEIYNIFPVIDLVFENHGTEACITSANDRTHMDGSLHYKDRALDLRSHTLQSGDEQNVVNELRAALGLDYDILLEDLDTPNEHIHIEYDPK